MDKKEKFEAFHKALDEDILMEAKEERERQVKKFNPYAYGSLAAACALVVIAGAVAVSQTGFGNAKKSADESTFAEFSMLNSVDAMEESDRDYMEQKYFVTSSTDAELGCDGYEGDVACDAATIANPVSESGKEELLEYGFEFSCPESAENIAYSRINMGTVYMGQVTFTINGTEYTCREKKTDAPEDISGLYYSFDNTKNVELSDEISGSLYYFENGTGHLDFYSNGLSCSIATDSLTNTEDFISLAKTVFASIIK
ncbi:MAG: hypothetical protein K6B75_01485 [Lachnospiraceae bacterium]|nr:hypothetical protein [Lachnospiraceae bacterium]